MYVCTDCHQPFERPKRVVDRHGLDAPPFEVVHVCPSCFGWAYIEAFECTACGELITNRYARTESGGTYCDNCFTIRHTHDDLTT